MLTRVMLLMTLGFLGGTAVLSSEVTQDMDMHILTAEEEQGWTSTLREMCS